MPTSEYDCSKNPFMAKAMAKAKKHKRVTNVLERRLKALEGQVAKLVRWQKNEEIERTEG